MGFGGVHRCNLFPFFGLEDILEAPAVPLVLLINATDHVDALVVINQTVRGVSCYRKIS
jgi:hypothetical protein